MRETPNEILINVSYIFLRLTNNYNRAGVYHVILPQPSSLDATNLR